MEDSNLEVLRVTEHMKGSLLSAMKWLKFITVMGCVGTAFIAFCAVILLLVGFVGPGVDQVGPNIERIFALVGGVFYALVAAVYIYPLKKSFSLISNTRQALSGYQANYENAADDFTAIIRFMGIMTLIGLVLIVLYIVAMFLIVASVPALFD